MARFSKELQDFFFPTPTLEADPALERSEPSVAESAQRVTLMNLLELAGERTFGFLLVLLALPSALPIPAPGYSAPFGILIVLLATQMVLGLHRPWFPQRVHTSSLSQKQAQGIIKAGLPWLQRLESFSKPRLPLICNTRIGRIVIGLTMILMGIFMMIPIPGTNTIPAMIVFILGFSLIEEDGFIALMGLAAGLVGGGSVVVLLVKGLPILLDKIQGMGL